MNDQQIEEKFKKVDKNFDELRTEMHAGFKETKEDINAIKGDVKEIKENISELKKNISDLIDIVGFVSTNAVSKDEFNELKQEVTEIKKDVSGLKQDTTYFKSTMVTKDYLDEKLYECKSEIIQETRAGEKRLERLAGVLVEGQVISPTQHQFVMNG